MTFGLCRLPTSFPSQSFNNALCLCSLCSFVFGIVSMVTGLLGACLGSILSRLFRNKVPYVDPLICAVGLLTSAPLTIIGLFVVMTSIPATYVRYKPLSFLSS